jgi:hypothetical protein
MSVPAAEYSSHTALCQAKSARMIWAIDELVKGYSI